MKLKSLLRILFVCFCPLISNAQYIESASIEHFEGTWVAYVNDRDSIVLEMKYEEKFPFKFRDKDTGISADVLLLSFKYYESGKIYLNSDNYWPKLGSNFALLEEYNGDKNGKLIFTYYELSQGDDSHIGKGILNIKDDVMKMEIDTTREGIVIILPKNDPSKERKVKAKMIMPKNLTFVRREL
ncbi:hypothetical protein Belba_3351 [Belliella baltica DSM 15883]|uniref:Lipocalin-like domain-containing protein n=1 Tax=Belliella baltica (strain DSM 15883 / CIP 108006 / LMG 21964 / BA134) TaxID=866536 RepID=I3Z9D7_BELBD|nr:hypothetical protein [Belliella baltica]AFL85855.1 hypothetical protein Belba_3351 [Belliella baltica DSM 15883]